VTDFTSERARINLAQTINKMAAASFSMASLEADEALWGSFWHFDVIGPGYRLPAVELNLLRAIRLDQSWPAETTPAQFLADLRQAILNPQAGVWRIRLAGTLCFIAAAPTGHGLITVAWYGLGQLQAGYRVGPGQLNLGRASQLKAPGFDDAGTDNRPAWPAQTIQNRDIGSGASVALRLDTEILKLRAGI
jgi:hypothetical protein